MRPGGGAEKGAKWERYLAKRLSLWVTDGKRDDVFWRTALSGGRATFQLRRHGIVNRAQAGDMQAIAAEGLEWCEKYLWEYKHRDDLNFTQLLTRAGGLLVGFWRDTVAVAQRLEKYPILIGKEDRYPAIVLSPLSCKIFAAIPKAIFPELGAQMHWFEPVTAPKLPAAALIKPLPQRIKRPGGSAKLVPMMPPKRQEAAD